MLSRTMKSTGASSDKYGACEKCGKFASDVWHAAIYDEYAPGQFAHIGDQFGHQECLLGWNRNEARNAPQA